MKYKDLAPKPSDALAAMIDAVLIAKYAPEDAFIFDTASFGGANLFGVCIGCVATATLQALAGVTFEPKNISQISSRAAAAKIEVRDLDDFENAIDSARRGYFSRLGDYYEVLLPDPIFRPKLLDTSFEDEELIPYGKYVDQLRAAGL